MATETPGPFSKGRVFLHSVYPIVAGGLVESVPAHHNRNARWVSLPERPIPAWLLGADLVLPAHAHRDRANLRVTVKVAPATSLFVFGELPAWALFPRHTCGIILRQTRFDLNSPDFRPALVLDRSVDTELDGISLDRKSGRPMIAAHASPGIRILNPSHPLAKDELRQWKAEPATP